MPSLPAQIPDTQPTDQPTLPFRQPEAMEARSGLNLVTEQGTVYHLPKSDTPHPNTAVSNEKQGLQIPIGVVVAAESRPNSDVSQPAVAQSLPLNSTLEVSQPQSLLGITPVAPEAPSTSATRSELKFVTSNEFPATPDQPTLNATAPVNSTESSTTPTQPASAATDAEMPSSDPSIEDSSQPGSQSTGNLDDASHVSGVFKERALGVSQSTGHPE